MGVSFVRGAASLTLPDPSPEYPVMRERRQAVGRTAGGAVFVYEKGPARLLARVRFESLTDAEKEGLKGFFDSEGCGAKNAFTYTDSSGTAWTARFAEPALRLTKVCGNVWDAEFSMELESE